GALDPNFPPPVFPFLGRFGFGFFGWAYSDVRRYAYDISNGSGRSMSFSTTVGHIAGDPSARSTTLNWSFARYIRMPWQSHILAFAYTGGTTFGSSRTAGIFSTGGFPDQTLQDILLDQIHLGGRALRGYPAFSDFGRQLQLLQGEYRFLIWRV